MDAALARLQVWPVWQEAKRFTVSAVHEDSATGARVEEFCQMLVKYLRQTAAINKQMWLLAELRTAPLRAIAGREAAVADLVIVSVHHAEVLPKEVRAWIEAWLKQRGKRPAVLLALFDPPYLGTSSSMQGYLREVAQRGKMEFFARIEDKSED